MRLTEQLASTSMVADEGNVAFSRVPVLVKHSAAAFVPMWNFATELQSFCPLSSTEKSFKFGSRN
jgi:hypothetical protein